MRGYIKRFTAGLEEEIKRYVFTEMFERIHEEMAEQMDEEDTLNTLFFALVSMIPHEELKKISYSLSDYLEMMEEM